MKRYTRYVPSGLIRAQIIPDDLVSLVLGSPSGSGITLTQRSHLGVFEVIAHLARPCHLCQLFALDKCRSVHGDHVLTQASASSDVENAMSLLLVERSQEESVSGKPNDQFMRLVKTL